MSVNSQEIMILCREICLILCVFLGTTSIIFALQMSKSFEGKRPVHRLLVRARWALRALPRTWNSTFNRHDMHLFDDLENLCNDLAAA